jgi:2',3'-cyclic-nucleotide 2'-phosphodiesterase (5'-nucleotidase family)
MRRSSRIQVTQIWKDLEEGKFSILHNTDLHSHQINMNFNEVSYEGNFLCFTFEINGAVHSGF